MVTHRHASLDVCDQVYEIRDKTVFKSVSMIKFVIDLTSNEGVSFT